MSQTLTAETDRVLAALDDVADQLHAATGQLQTAIRNTTEGAQSGRRD